MKLLSQRDPQWAADKMGASNLTLGAMGCTTTCISMIGDYFGEYKSPKELAHDADNYTPSGLVLWWRFSAKYKNMDFVKRVKGTTEQLMPEIREALADPDRAVTIQVNNQAHWVVAYSTRWWSNDLAVADPWMLPGKVVPCLKTYNNITGAAYWKRVKGTDIVVPDAPKPKPITVKPGFVKAISKPEIYFYNGEELFHYPNWYSFTMTGGDMEKVQHLPDNIVEDLKVSRYDMRNVEPKSNSI